jgi:N-acetylmuramic acid 6-phosphate etherase
MSLDTLVATEATNPETLTIDALSTEAMLRLINQQDQQVALAVAEAIPAMVSVVEAIAKAFTEGGRLIYVGAGTSGRLGVLDASECPPTFGVSPELVQALIAGGEAALRQAIEGAEDDEAAGEADILALRLTPLDVVVGLSASGGAPYVCGAIKAAKQVGVSLTASVTCVANSPITQVADVAVVAPTGAEVLAGSTRLKAGTAQKLILNMLTTASMINIGKTYGNLMVDVQPTNAKLRLRAQRLVVKIGEVSEEKALGLLQAANWQVKPAIVMAKTGLSLEEATQKLKVVAGNLRLAL